MKNKILYLCGALLSLIPTFVHAQSMDANRLIAFPTAEGYGKYTVGGRGGKVYEVTNLNDSGEGSLRAAVEAKGPRTVVFRVSGTIDLQRSLSIKNPYITIAGQTAPGDGICLKRYPLQINANEVIIRYIRVRLGDETGDECDAIGGRYHSNIILDHVSVSWSIDECVSVYRCKNVTIQWCLIAESLFMSNHKKGYHGFGGIWGSNYSTYHHNLIANHSSRNPRFGDGVGHNDYRNNVIYNWAYNTCYGGERYNNNNPDFNFATTINLVANYYKPGPATRPGETSWRIANPTYDREKEINGMWYIADNYVEGAPRVNADNWDGGVQIKGDAEDLKRLRLEKPWDAMKINEQTPQEAYQAVIANVGATLPKRDAVDTRIINDMIKGTASCEGPGYKLKGRQLKDRTVKCGIIDKPFDVGGWPKLKSCKAPVDSDHDGIPDEWEKKHGLNPTDSSDGAKIASNGYTNLENYLNSLCKD